MGLLRIVYKGNTATVNNKKQPAYAVTAKLNTPFAL